MPNVLLEIGMEEIPARFIDGCIADLTKLIESAIDQSRLATPDTNITAMATYRRFSFVVTSIHGQQADIDETLEGPPLRIAKNDDGEWLPPAIGFAKKCGIEPDQLQSTTNKKGDEVLMAKRFIKGQAAVDCLPSVLEAAIAKMKLPIAMVWGNNIGPFIRPIQWVCAMVDTTVLPITLFGVQAGNVSYGHRFLTQGDDASSGQVLTIESPLTYTQQLTDANVMVDQQQRRDHINTQLNDLIPSVDQALLNEVTHLAEWPVALEIEFDEQFLELPKEVLVECLKKHQKAFLVDTNDGLKNACVIIADSVTETNKATIIAGNRRVMMARLNDVRFFWDEDLKANGFKGWNEALNRIVFQEGLGSIGDKVERICHICHTICDQLDVDKTTRDNIDRAAHRAKADLVCQMIGELPSLQGTMGGYYALRFKEEPVIATAIAEHYNPRFDGDDLPSHLEAVVIAIADRIDTMVACFENNAIPTGSRDPWGIRRSMIAITRMIVANQLPLNLHLLLEDATITLDKPVGENFNKCSTFFMKRIESVCLEMGLAPDVIQLVSGDFLTQPLHAIQQGIALKSLKSTQPDQYGLLLDTTTRVAKLIDGFSSPNPISDAYFEHEIERQAYDTFQNLQAKSDWLLNANDVQATVAFCETLSTYFDSVLVNADNPAVAQNRRSFIKLVNDHFGQVGDWLKLTK